MIVLVLVLVGEKANGIILHDYEDALSKSILFFEGQRSGKLPSTQRFTWRKDSALRDGLHHGVMILSQPHRSSIFLFFVFMGILIN